MDGHKDVFEKNKAAFFKAYPQEAALWIDGKYEKSNLSIGSVSVADGVENLLVEKDGRKLVLDGVFGSRERIQEQITSWGTIPSKMPLFVVGMSNLEHIRAYLEAAREDCLVLVYEPSIEIFSYVMEHFLIEDLILDSPVMFVIDQLNTKSLEDKIAAILNIDTLSSLKTIVSPNYDILFPDKTEAAVKLLKKKYTNLIIMWNTMRRFTDVAGLNSIFNIRHLLHGYNISQLKGMLRNEVPAIIISAGPSLNKNIEELKDAKGKACLIAVDTAIKPLLNRGIVPDFFVIVDGKKPTELMEHPRISEVPLVTCGVVSRGIMDLHQGKKFFYYSDDSLEGEIFKRARKESGKKENLFEIDLPTGGSVANTAFSLALYMEASQIILVGQDLALTNGRTHADGTFKAKMEKLSDEQMKDTIEVEGIYGKPVLTRSDFYMYLQWFEDQIAKKKLKNVYDATQGGAKIHGTTVITLQKAIQRFCNKPVNIADKVNKLPEMMDWGAKKEFVDLYNHLPERMSEVYEKALEGEKLYLRLEKICKRNELKEDAYRKIVKKIERINDYMNTNKYALFVQGNLMDLNYIMRTSIYQQEENERDERISLAQQGQVMSFYIRREAEKWIEITKQVVERRPIEVCREDIQGPLDRLLYDLECEEEVE